MRPTPKAKASLRRSGSPVAERARSSSPSSWRPSLPSAREAPALARGASPGRKSPRGQVLAAFKAFDANGDGTVERWELHELFRRLGDPSLSKAGLDRLFDAADCNRDGKIHLQEFIDFVWYEETRVGKSELMDAASALASPAAAAAPRPRAVLAPPPETSPLDLLRTQSATGVDAEKLQGLMDEVVAHVGTSTGVDASTAVLLLMHVKWDAELAIKKFAEDSAALLSAAGADANHPARRGQPCSVCFVEEAVSCLPCGHGLCADDWSGFLKSNLDSGTVDGENCTRLRCPGEHCPLLVPPSRFQQFLEPGDYQRYRGLLLLSFTNDGQKICQCSAPGCGLYVISQSRKSMVTCKCGHAFCFSCGLPPHQPVQCVQAREWLAMVEDAPAEQGARAEPQDTKSCPNPDCGVPSYKVSGCHHLTCPRCKEQWCWMCGQWGGGPSERPPPHHVFTCNDDINAAWKSLHRALGPLMHRYDNHLSSLKIISSEGDKLLADLGGAARVKSGDAKLVKDAINVLIECRRALAWSYVQCYFEDSHDFVLKMMDGQNSFEKEVEQFNQMLSADWMRVMAEDHEIPDLAAAILEGRMHQLRCMIDDLKLRRPK